MKLLIKNVPGLTVPSRAHIEDAGLDVVATSINIIGTKSKEDSSYYRSIDYIEYGTNLYVCPLSEEATHCPHEPFAESENFHIDLRSRSSVSKYNLLLCNGLGLVDQGYRGELKFRFKYIFQPQDFKEVWGEILGKIDESKIYKIGDKIGQLVVSRTWPVEIEVVNEIPESHRNTGGFGSTGA